MWPRFEQMGAQAGGRQPDAGEGRRMGARKPPTQKTSQASSVAGEDRKCPHCGAWQSEGGCAAPETCAQALAKVEADYAREVTDLLAQEQNRSLPLLMAGFEALDLLNIGLVVTSSAGLLLMANRAAEQVLEERDGLELTQSGMLEAMKNCCPSLSAALQHAARAGHALPTRPEDSVIAVHRPSGKRGLTLLVRSVKRPRGEREAGGPCALVFILDPELPIEAAEAELRQLYGLTNTEARLANLLMEGKTLDQCCDLLDIRRSTGRTHLQHVFEKLGVQRQTELVAVLLKSIGLVRTGSKDKKSNSVNSPERIQRTLLRMLMGRVARTTTIL
jgi:DNA-binding CsgD family transcriptional regulator